MVNIFISKNNYTKASSLATITSANFRQALIWSLVTSGYILLISSKLALVIVHSKQSPPLCGFLSKRAFPKRHCDFLQYDFYIFSFRKFIKSTIKKDFKGLIINKL